VRRVTLVEFTRFVVRSNMDVSGKGENLYVDYSQ